MKKKFTTINYLLVLAVTVVLTYTITYNVEEWWQGASLWFSLINRLAEAFIFSYVIYYYTFMREYLSELKTVKENANFKVFRIYMSMTSIVTPIIRFYLGDVDIGEDLDSLDTKMKQAKKGDFFSDAIENTMVSVGSKYVVMKTKPSLTFRMILDSFYRDLDRFSGDIGYYDNNLLSLVNRIRFSMFLEVLEYLTYDLGLEQASDLLDARRKDFLKFYQLYRELGIEMDRLGMEKSLEKIKSEGYVTKEDAEPNVSRKETNV